MTMWAAVIGVALGSYVIRLVPLLLIESWRPSERVESLIARAGIAAVAALVGLMTRSASTVVPQPPLLCAVAVGAVGASRGWSLMRVVVVGGGVYACVRVIISLFA